MQEQKHKDRKHPVLRRILMILLWLFVTVFLLLITVVILIQLPPVQNFLTQKAVTYLSGKIHSKVELGRIEITFPKKIHLQDLYIEDQKKDTLIYFHDLWLGIDLFGLLSNKININSVEIEKLRGHVYRNYPDTTFNFSFIPEAFAGDKSKPAKPADTANTMKFSIHKIRLGDIRLTYNDTISGINAAVKIGVFRTVIDEFDTKTMSIRAGTLDLRNSFIALRQSVPLSEKPPDTAASVMDISLKRSDISDVKFSLKSYADTMDAGVSLGKLELRSAKLHGDTISLESAGIEKTFITYDNNRKGRAAGGMDFNHIQLSDLLVKLKDLKMDHNHAVVDLENLAFREKSGFELKSFHTKLKYDTTQVELADLDIQTNHSRIRSYLAAKFPSIKTISGSPEKTNIKVILEDASVAMQDVFMFVPELAKDPALRQNNNLAINVSARMQGSLERLEINSFDLRTNGTTRIRLEGVIQNLMHQEKLYADVRLKEFLTSRSDIVQMVPEKMLPENIVIPSFAEAEGSFRGYLKNFDAVLNFRSSVGGISAKMSMYPAKGTVARSYKGNVTLEAFDVGKLLNQPENAGPVTMDLNIAGSGLDTASIKADLEANIKSAVLKGYEYKDLNIKGRITKMAFDGVASIEDENIAFSYKGVTDFDPHHPGFNIDLYLKGANLKALNLSKDDLRISGTVNADLQAASGKNILGKASLARVLIIRNDEKITVDSVIFTSGEEKGISDVRLRLPGLNAGLHGNFLLAETAPLLMRHVSKYYKFSDVPDTAHLHPQKFDFFINLDDPFLAEKFVPSLKHLTPFEIKGNFDSDAGKLDLNGKIDQIILSGLTIDSLDLNTGSQRDELKYSVHVASVFNDMLRVTQFALDGNIHDNQIIFAINSQRGASGKMIALSGKISREGQETRVKLNPDLTLINTKWAVSPDNYLSFGKNLYVHDLTLSEAQQKISVKSKGTTPDSPLDVNFTNFDIGLLSGIIENQTELVRGKLDGKFSIIKSNNATGFTSDLTIKNFSFQKVPVGDITLKAESRSPGLFDLNLGLGGGENDLIVSGTYATANKGTIDLLMDIRKLSMRSVEPFTFGQVTKMSGSASGKIKITGTTAKPGLDGNLKFTSFAFRPKFLGSPLKMQDNELLFSGGKVVMNNLTLLDSLNNSAILDGFADISDLTKIAFDITMKTKNFLALNTTKKDNPVYFGKVYLDSDLHLKGTQQRPVINMKINLNKGTEVTFVNQSKAGIVESEGVVAFVDSISLQNPIMTADSLKRQKITELDLKATIGIDENVLLKMMVDPVSGDSAFVKGKAALEFTLDPSGTMSLTGSYHVNDGGYHLSVSSFLKRDFTIQKGSTVVWTGDIMDARLNLTAVYTVKTSPLLLLEDQLSGGDQEQKNKYRNTLNFLVLMKMSGLLSKPELKFDIDLAPRDRGAMGGTVYAKLAELREDESQLNKQVFALLTLNRFIGQDPLESGNAPITVSSAARSSASKLLTDQLNSLSQKYVKGVELNVGVNSYEDYSSGQAQGRTQLQLGVSKQLMQGRVEVQVGGDIDIEGEKASQNNLSDIAGNISVEYKVTENGRWKLKGFRTNEYQNPIEGELVKTGIGLIYTKDFNKIKRAYLKEKANKK